MENILSIKNLSVSYGVSSVLDNVTLNFHSGSISCLIGPSGSGKSTLLRVLNNLEKNYTGEIFLNHQPIDTQTMHSQHLVGMIFQAYHIFEHMTVLQNVQYTLQFSKKLSQSEAHARAIDILDQFELTPHLQKYSKYLSGGQRQRLAIARTLALDPSIICFDEPTSALDLELTRAFADIVIRLSKKDKIILIATHDQSLLEFLPEARVYQLASGHIDLVQRNV